MLGNRLLEVPALGDLAPHAKHFKTSICVQTKLKNILYTKTINHSMQDVYKSISCSGHTLVPKIVRNNFKEREDEILLEYR